MTTIPRHKEFTVDDGVEECVPKPKKTKTKRIQAVRLIGAKTYHAVNVAYGSTPVSTNENINAKLTPVAFRSVVDFANKQKY